ncbi:hypothetical protein P3G55_18910 [Leptospira sp. 96542]|nr:hypothetical protein [Leptospira sp. 96542]
MMTRAVEEGQEPDIIQLMLSSVRKQVALTPEQEQAIEQEIRAEAGGLRVRIPKRGKHPSAERRAAIYRHAMTNAPEQEVLEQGGISRATLYRLIKREPN